MVGKSLKLAVKSGLVILVACAAATSLLAWDKQVDDIIAKARKAYDPEGKLKDVKTEILSGVFNGGPGNQGQLELKFKHPNMFRIKATLDDAVSMVKAYDGKEGWEFTSEKGFRLIKGNELDELKLQVLIAAPCLDFKRLFANVVLEGKEKVAGAECWKLSCLPQKSFKSQPLVCYVDAKTSLVAKMIETQDLQDGTMTVVTLYQDYETIDGVVIPTTIISETEGQVTEATFDSVEFNIPIDDTDFDPPEAFGPPVKAPKGKGGAK